MIAFLFVISAFFGIIYNASQIQILMQYFDVVGKLECYTKLDVDNFNAELSKLREKKNRHRFFLYLLPKVLAIRLVDSLFQMQFWTFILASLGIIFSLMALLF